MTSTKTIQKQFTTRENQIRCIELRKQGFTHHDIGKAIGISPGYVSQLISKGMKAALVTPAEELIEMEIARLDALWYPAFAAATVRQEDGTPIFNKDATDTCLKLMERRAKLLGLDKPVKAEIKKTLIATNMVSIYIPNNGRDPRLQPVVVDNESQEILEEKNIVTIDNEQTFFEWQGEFIDVIAEEQYE